MPGALDQLVADLRAWLGSDQPGIAWLAYGRERDRDEVLRRLGGEDPVTWLDRQLQALPPSNVRSATAPRPA